MPKPLLIFYLLTIPFVFGLSACTIRYLLVFGLDLKFQESDLVILGSWLIGGCLGVLLTGAYLLAIPLFFACVWKTAIPCTASADNKMSHLEKLKKTFDEIGVPYVIEDGGEGWVCLYTCTKEEQANQIRFKNRIVSDVFFEFENGELASSP